MASPTKLVAWLLSTSFTVVILSKQAGPFCSAFVVPPPLKLQQQRGLGASGRFCSTFSTPRVLPRESCMALHAKKKNKNKDEDDADDDDVIDAEVVGDEDLFASIEQNHQQEQAAAAASRRRRRQNEDEEDEYEDDDDDDYDEENVEDENDWRAFRAKLVMDEDDEEYDDEERDQVAFGAFSTSQYNPFHGKKQNKQKKHKKHKKFHQNTKAKEATTSSDQDEEKSSWAYESGSDNVETGTVLLNRPPHPSDDFGYGLGKQYMHKSVVLILEHDLHFRELIKKQQQQQQQRKGQNPRDDDLPPPEIQGKETKAVILNRPTDLILDNEEKDVSCRIWYGGEEHGIHDPLDPKFFCLHVPSPTLINNKNYKWKKMSHTERRRALDQSTHEVMRGVYFTTLSNAKQLIHDGVAQSMDEFWCFSGYTTWAPGELEEEISEGYWHAVSTDAKTLRNGLRILTVGGGRNEREEEEEGEDGSKDPREAGLRTWSVLMDRIGQCDEYVGCTLEDNDDEDQTPNFNPLGIHNHNRKDVGHFDAVARDPSMANFRHLEESFDDLMLREWAHQFLVFNGSPPPFLRDDHAKEGTSTRGGSKVDEYLSSFAKKKQNRRTGRMTPLEEDEEERRMQGPQLEAGSIVRGSSAERSPFLLHHQEYHKSVMLIMQHNSQPGSEEDDDEDEAVGTVGVLLNRPSAEKIHLEGIGTFPLFYGGPMELPRDKDGQRSLFVLHKNPMLRRAGVGMPVAAPRMMDVQGSSSTRDPRDGRYGEGRDHGPNYGMMPEEGPPQGGEPPFFFDEEEEEDMIYRCTLEEAAEAIRWEVAVPEDFLIARGFCIWPGATMAPPESPPSSSSELPEKRPKTLEDLLREGHFELMPPIPSYKMQEFWDVLSQQDVTASWTINRNLFLSNRAWEIAGGDVGRERDGYGFGYEEEDGGIEDFRDGRGGRGRRKKKRRLPFLGKRSRSRSGSRSPPGWGAEEEDEYDEGDGSGMRGHRVFNSDVKVSTLGDAALKTWMAAFFLDDPRVRP